MAIRKPDVSFVITICPVFDVFGCAAKMADEARGFFGFHQFTQCHECSVVSRGYEFWGENGHLQGHSPADRRELAARLRYLAAKQTRMRDGRIMGNRIQMGQAQYYVGRAA